MIEFEFGPEPWDELLQSLNPGDILDAVRFLAVTESADEDQLQQTMEELDQRKITLDISSLEKLPASGELAVRLRQEQDLVKRNALLKELEETDPLRLYLEELAAIPAAGDIQLLAEQYAGGDEAAAQRLADLSLSCCVEIACRMTGRGILLLDLIQEASLGLWQGILSYTGGAFEAHRDWWINQYLTKAVTLQARAGGVGQKLRAGMEDYRDVDQRLLAELGRNPTLEEIAEAMHTDVNTASVYGDMLAAARNRKRVEESREEPEHTPEEDQAVEDTAYFQSRQRIMELLSALTEQETKLLTLRFGLEGGLPLSPEETGKKLGMTPHEVVTMEAAALGKLRQE